jgi:hypothetical protein
MDGQPSNSQIIGVALVLFCTILLGVGIHHMVSIGTCSSTGYSANYGPVPHCPAGTGWWFAFLFGGIIGGLVGALMAGNVAMVFGGIFGGIGFGALSIVLDAHASSGTKIFGAIFGGCFAIVGVVAIFAVVRNAFSALSSASRGSGSNGSGVTRSGLSGSGLSGSGLSGSGLSGSGLGGSGLGGPAPSASGGDPILGAYNAAQSTAPRPAPRAVSPSVASFTPPAAKSSNAVEELEKLADLHKRGAVTDAEFAAAKAKLLGEM